MIYLLCILLGIAIDQAVKVQIVKYLPLFERVDVLGSFFQLTHFVNKGAAWGFLSSFSWGIHVLTAISAVAACIFSRLLLKSEFANYRWPFVLLTAGTVGNLLDRVFYQGVVDMFSLRFGSYQYPIFNVADILLVCGTFLLLYLLLSEEKKGRKQELHEER